MKKFVLSVVTAVSLCATQAVAADLKMVTKAPPAPPSPWDFAFGSALMSDYIWRGITQSNHRPSVAAYFEPRYNVNANWQLYAGVSGESISFPNRAAAEIDFYGGVRPTFGKLALDFGVWYYYYPGGQCFSNGTFTGLTAAQACSAFNSGGNLVSATGLPINGNNVKAILSFWEVYGKGTYTVNDHVSFGGSVYYSPSVLNSGANGTYVAGTAKYTGTAFANGIGWYVSGDYGYWWLGTSDAFYGTAAFPNGINYVDYSNWDLGIGFTYKVFTLDVRYYGTNLSKGDCNAFTSDHTAFTTGSITAINPAPGFGSNWCDQRVVVKFSADLTAAANLK